MKVTTLIVLASVTLTLALPGNTTRGNREATGPGGPIASITAYADSMGFSWRWERDFKRLTCMRHPDQVRFYEGKRFYRKKVNKKP